MVAHLPAERLLSCLSLLLLLLILATDDGIRSSSNRKRVAIGLNQIFDVHVSQKKRATVPVSISVGTILSL